MKYINGFVSKPTTKVKRTHIVLTRADIANLILGHSIAYRGHGSALIPGSALVISFEPAYALQVFESIEMTKKS